MASEAQVAANRRNAGRSTGPRTTQGKAVVAQNAIKHGLLARQDVIKGEDQQGFDLHRDQLLGELVPVGPVESMLAERIVSLSWRRKRWNPGRWRLGDLLCGTKPISTRYDKSGAAPPRDGVPGVSQLDPSDGLTTPVIPDILGAGNG